MTRRPAALEDRFQRLAAEQRQQSTELEIKRVAETLKPTKRGGWGKAKRTVCAYAHRHASKMEARVCERLTLECRATGDTLMQQVRLSLWNLRTDADGRPLTASIDFAVVRECRLHRLIDAKPKRWQSRDWRRGRAAVEACYGIKVEEVSK